MLWVSWGSTPDSAHVSHFVKNFRFIFVKYITIKMQKNRYHCLYLMVQSGEQKFIDNTTKKKLWMNEWSLIFNILLENEH